jgi:hypothetical protein
LRRWYDDQLEALATEGREYLEGIRSTGQALALKAQEDLWRARESIEQFYGDTARLWFCSLDEATLLGALVDDRRRGFLAGPGGEQLIRTYWILATGADAGQRRRAGQFFSAIAAALDPERSRGQPTRWNSRRIRLFYRFRRRLNTRLRVLLDHFVTPPPAQWLPVVDLGDGDLVSMARREWPDKAARIFLANWLDIAATSLDRHIQRGRTTGDQ